jgi:hypothetical protein
MQESSLSVQVLSSGPLCLSLCTCPPDPLSIGPPSRLHSPTCATIRFPPYSPRLYTTQQSAHSVRMSALAIGDGGRPAFSLENRWWRWWVKQLQSALELPCARVVRAASPSTALDRRSECDQSSFRQDLHSCSGFCASDSQ